MSANTTPDNIVYPVSTDPVAPLETVFAALATSVQTALTGQGKYFAPTVATQAARDALFTIPVQGNRVFRADKGWEEAYFGLYNVSTNPSGATPAGWYPISGNLPFGHMGRTGGLMSVATADTRIVMEAAQALAGGVTFDDSLDALVVPVAGRYEVKTHFMASGGGGGVPFVGSARKNGVVFPAPSYRAWKGDAFDYYGGASAIVNLAAADKISMVMTFAASTGGTTGYNGSWLEIIYVGPPTA